MANEFLSVSELTRKIKRHIDNEPQLQNVWIRGEISNFNHHSRGHMYFTMKDDKSKINCVMFAGNNRFLKFQPENGMSVLARGDVSVYEPYGQYQLYVKEMQPDGVGNLYLAFEQLKDKLEKKGYFSQERKKNIPKMPKRIAVATSPTGAAVRDILTTLKRRFPIARVTLFPVLVQGNDAPSSIANAIYRANAMKKFDVMIIGRGGGSIEELWAFNEQVVADAIYESEIPIISAVGHETDVTISDFVADLRAPTPTAAAELAVPDMTELLRTIQESRTRLIQAMDRKRKQEQERLQFLTRSYAFRYPKQLIEQKEQDLDRLVDTMIKSLHITVDQRKRQITELEQRLKRVHPWKKWKDEKENYEQLKQRFLRLVKQQISDKETKYSLLLSKLNVLSPLNMMKRGYSLVYNAEENLVKRVDDVKEKEQITVRLQDGQLQCLVEERTHEKLFDWRDDDGK